MRGSIMSVVAVVAGFGLGACAEDETTGQTETPSILSETGCPSLAGVYDCPARGDTPAIVLTLTESYAGTIATYRYVYDYVPSEVDDVEMTVTASQSGETEDGFVGTCVTYAGGPSMNFGPDDKDLATERTYNFVNGDGNLQADTGGETQIVCTRRP